MIELYFDAPPGGIDANAEVFDQAAANASGQSPFSEDVLTFRQVGSSWLIVEYDVDPGDASSSTKTAVINAVEAVYGVTHRRTVER